MHTENKHAPVKYLDLLGNRKPSFWCGGKRLAASGNCLGFSCEAPAATAIEFTKEQCAEIGKFAMRAVGVDVDRLIEENIELRKRLAALGAEP